MLLHGFQRDVASSRSVVIRSTPRGYPSSALGPVCSGEGCELPASEGGSIALSVINFCSTLSWYLVPPRRFKTWLSSLCVQYNSPPNNYACIREVSYLIERGHQYFLPLGWISLGLSISSPHQVTHFSNARVLTIDLGITALRISL